MRGPHEGAKYFLCPHFSLEVTGAGRRRYPGIRRLRVGQLPGYHSLYLGTRVLSRRGVTQD